MTTAPNFDDEPQLSLWIEWGQGDYTELSVSRDECYDLVDAAERGEWVTLTVDAILDGTLTSTACHINTRLIRQFHVEEPNV